METAKNKVLDIKSSMYWWLNTNRPFIINNEYKIELLELNRKHYTAKILITNLKDNSQTLVEKNIENDTE